MLWVGRHLWHPPLLRLLLAWNSTLCPQNSTLCPRSSTKKRGKKNPDFQSCVQTQQKENPKTPQRCLTPSGARGWGMGLFSPRFNSQLSALLWNSWCRGPGLQDHNNLSLMGRERGNGHGNGTEPTTAVRE